MNKQEVINKINGMTVETFFSGTLFVKQKEVIKLIEQLDESETGHADEAPRYVKNILARLRELPLHDREVWLKAIMGEFEQDFSRAKWREGYEQGRIEGMLERDKVTIPQYIADKIEYCKELDDYNLFRAIDYCCHFNKCNSWLMFKNNIETFALAYIFGYEVEEELKYIVKFKGFNPRYIILKYQPYDKTWFLGGEQEYEFYRTHHTRKELEDAGFGWVFDCEGIEIEEVTE